jgi:FkbM family methyltransferase
MLVNGVELKEQDDMVCLAARRNDGHFEPETFEYLQSLNPKGTFVDIGAYTGIYGIWAAKRGYSVQFFEPHPVIYERMVYNMFDNNVTGNCYNVALSDRLEKRQFFMNPSPTMTSAGSLIESRGKGYAFDVSSYPYSYYATGDESTIKIDVEGAELSVLKGMVSVLELEKPALVIEVLDRNQENEVVAFLKPYGYNSLGKFDGRNIILSV